MQGQDGRLAEERNDKEKIKMGCRLMDKNNPSWRGGRHWHKGGLRLLRPDHKNAAKDGYIFEHRLIAEKIICKPLPEKVVIHHHPSNPSAILVICQDNVYHLFLHQRINAYRNCGHVDWRKCKYCKQYDSVENLSISTGNGKWSNVYHKKCENRRKRIEYARKKMEVQDGQS